MLPDGHAPKIGAEARMLGVRAPLDIAADENGMVLPGTGGMSVAPEWSALPPHRIPRRLRSYTGLSAATGSNATHISRIGDGPFVGSAVSSGLFLRIDANDSRHGLVEPDAIMQLLNYRERLAATRNAWVIDEPMI